MKKQISRLRQLREDKGDTLEEVSRNTRIPYATIRLLEVGMGKNFRKDIKQKLAEYYGKNLFFVFPEEYEKVYSSMYRKGYHLLAVIEDWFPKLNLTYKERLLWTKHLDRTPPEDIDFLNSGETEENVRTKMKELVKNHDLEDAEKRKRIAEKKRKK